VSNCSARVLRKVLLVSKWAHVVSGMRALGIELDDDEHELLGRVSDMLEQGETELDDNSPIAARLLRYWATFYEDTWVWGGKSSHPVAFFFLPLFPFSFFFLNFFFSTPIKIPTAVSRHESR
jgi:hypothetical protein